MSLVLEYRNQHSSPWSASVARRLRDLWLENKRVVIITDLLNREFGLRLNRNAVIGKAHRLGLPKHMFANKLSLNPEDVAERKARRLQYQREWRANNRDKMNATERRYYARLKERQTAPQIEDYSIPTPQRKTIFELGKHDCRWPVGEPKSELFFFCGAGAEKDKPYCSSHCLRAFVETRRTY